MPGQLKPDARCPICDRPLDALVDTTSNEGVKREFFHTDKSRKCVESFAGTARDSADRERRKLEV